MIKIEFKDKQFILSNDAQEVIGTKNPRRILRELRDIMDLWERELKRRKLI